MSSKIVCEAMFRVLKLYMGSKKIVAGRLL